MVIMDHNKEWELSSEGKKCCTDCKTTKTPLWRGGPAGPKSLCNACGIRYRKRRASSSSSATTVGMMSKGQDRKRQNDGSSSSSSSSSESDDVCGNSEEMKESCLKVKLVQLGEEVWLQHRSSSSSSSWVVKEKKQRKRKSKLGEEEQAAFCLMAISCGFVFA